MPVSSLKWSLPILFLLSLVSCGSEPDQSRPIEILYFVQGPSGAEFELVGPGDTAGCMAESTERQGVLIPTGGFGLQSAGATHYRDGRFRAPHYFILENEEQPTRAVIRNLATAPLTVLRVLGAPNSSEPLVIAPGECRSFTTYKDRDEIAGFNIPPDDTPTPGGAGPTPTPGNPGRTFDLEAEQMREYRVEVCSFLPGTMRRPGFECDQLAPRGQATDVDGVLLRDAGLSFLGTLGDLEASFLTRCLQIDVNQQIECRTPATFFLNAPRDEISAVMTKLFNQTEGAFLQVDVYEADRRLGSIPARGTCSSGPISDRDWRRGRWPPPPAPGRSTPTSGSVDATVSVSLIHRRRNSGV